jgi:hypothetical protein
MNMNEFGDSYSISLKPWGLWACAHRRLSDKEFDAFCDILTQSGVHSREILGTHYMFFDISAVENTVLTFNQFKRVAHTLRQIGCKRGALLTPNWRTAAVSIEVWQGYGFADCWRALPADPIALNGVSAGYDWILHGKEPRLVVPNHIDDPDLRLWVAGLYGPNLT